MRWRQAWSLGKITEEVFERWNREAGSAELPEHVKPKGKKKRTARPAEAKEACLMRQCALGRAPRDARHVFKILVRNRANRDDELVI